MTARSIPLAAAGLMLASWMAAPAPALAQDAGVKAGVNLATFRLSPTDTGTTLTREPRFVGGLFAVAFERQPVSFQPEILYSVKAVTEDNGAAKNTITLKYVEIPLLARINLSGGRRRRAGGYLLFGPSIAFQTSARIKGESANDDFSKFVKDPDVGFLAGVGVRSGHFVAEARYTWGVRNLSTVPGQSLRNEALSLMAGVRFGGRR